MSLSDCPKCWSTPCECGYEWRNSDIQYRLKQAAVVLGVNKDELRDCVISIIPDIHPMKRKYP